MILLQDVAHAALLWPGQCAPQDSRLQPQPTVCGVRRRGLWEGIRPRGWSRLQGPCPQRGTSELSPREHGVWCHLCLWGAASWAPQSFLPPYPPRTSPSHMLSWTRSLCRRWSSALCLPCTILLLYNINNYKPNKQTGKQINK